ncbi:hypothetical protein ACSX1C_00295 [Pseudomonas sp. MBLB4123]|uniref:hypothetical protein n=1 Tax=Pseudomonas sp. MBLB4123 TaxID=3451557 RepID=UPI003F7558FB
MQIASYYTSIGFKVDLPSMKRVDKHLKQMEAKIAKQAQQFKKSMSLSFNEKNMPLLKFKKFQFDELALQKAAQTSLNRTSRLLRLQVNNFEIDQGKLNRQMQTSVQRAANQARVYTKTFTGNSGGFGVYDAGKPSAAHRYMTSTPYAKNAHSPLGSGAMAGLSAGSMLLGGPALAGAGAAFATVAGTRALYSGNQDAVQARNLIQNVVADPTLSEKENEVRGKNAFNYLYDESNRLGLNAKDNAETYAKLIAGSMASGFDLKTSQKMFSQMSEHSTVLHLSGENTKRLSVALAQIFAKGQVQAEELKG